MVPENSSGSCNTMLICRAQRRELHLAEVDAVEQDAPRRRVVEAGKQAYEGCLAGTRRADDGDRLTRLARRTRCP